jgi:hypothetical protein
VLVEKIVVVSACLDRVLSEPLRGKRKKYGQWSQSVMKMLIVWFVVLIVFSVLCCGKLSEVPDSSKVSITSHMWVRLGTSWIGAHVPTCAGPSFSSTPPQTQSQRERIDTGTAGDERAESAPEMTMEGDQMPWCFVQHRFGPFQPP